MTYSQQAQKIWEAALGELELLVTRPNFETWLKGTVGLELEDDHFIIGAPSPFVAEGLEKRMYMLIQQTLGRVLKRPVEVRFQVAQRREIKPKEEQEEGGESADQKKRKPLRLNSRYTFENFVVGAKNRLAHAAAYAATDAPGHSFNPLYIYGGFGLGKSHLLHAVAYRAMQMGRQALCLSAEEFTNEFVTALRQQRLSELRQRYMQLDLFLLDDIQFLAGREQTQRQFFHLFNDLYHADKQIILASDRPPRSVGFSEESLISRFHGGLIALIQSPDEENRLAILQARASLLGIAIPVEVLQFIASRVRQNVRELEGALNRVAAHKQLTDAPLTVEMASQILQDPRVIPGDPAFSRDTIIHAVAISFAVTPEALRGPSKNKSIALARHVAIYLLRQHTNASLAAIGNWFHRNPATIHDGSQRVEKALLLDPSLRIRLESIVQSLSSYETDRKFA